MVLLRNKLNQREKIDNFRPITLFNSELKMLAHVLAKKLVCVVDVLVGEA